MLVSRKITKRLCLSMLQSNYSYSAKTDIQHIHLL